MMIFVNGEKRETSAGTVAALVDSLGLPAQSVLVEHNSLALRRDEWHSHQLQPEDRIEIIRIVAGG
jgi:thiamine biosynthesis protein ThiS